MIRLKKVTVTFDGPSVRDAIVDAVAYAIRNSCIVEVEMGSRDPIRIDPCHFPFGSDMSKAVAFWCDTLLK